jgi:small conductance mechanosensitive channel
MFDSKYISEKFNLFLNNFIDTLPSLLLSIIIFVIFYIIAEYYRTSILGNEIKTQKNILEQEMLFESENLNKNLIYYQLSWIVYYSIILFGLIVSLVNLGFNVATIIALLGSIGLALGLALQETLKNMISGIYIGINKLFRIGDIISLKPLIGNTSITWGRITNFNLYYTTVIDVNNQITMIPNSMIQNNILTNITLSKESIIN